MGRNERISIDPVPRLFDVVELTAARTGLDTGAIGTIVEELPKRSYVVEFVDADGHTLAVETLAAGDFAVRR